MSNKLGVEGAFLSRSASSNGTSYVPIGLDLKLSAIAIMSAIGVTIAPTAYSQEEGTGLRLEEVIVTAQKKGVGESIQDVPLAITAFNSDIIEKRRLKLFGT